MKQLRQYDAERIRDAADRGYIGMASPSFIPFGALEIKSATGRARCRVCGCKIKKGEEVLTFAWDFYGSGSYTAIQSFIHRRDCKTST